MTGERDEFAASGLDSRPLYVQVRERLLKRISSGAWQPGQLIPNEFELARELGVSQGTARKALDSLAADNLLVRRQGRGTFVVEHTPSEMLFRFFNLRDAEGRAVVPGSTNVRVRFAKATAQECRKLQLAAGSDVVRITRLRTREDVPFIAEKIVLPAARFAGLAASMELPNTLYDHFQKHFGITVARGNERISTAAASVRDAKALGVEAGAPLLKLERLMYDVDNRIVEWRVSLCHLGEAYYDVSLR